LTWDDALPMLESWAEGRQDPIAAVTCSCVELVRREVVAGVQSREGDLDLEGAIARAGSRTVTA
jgi:hypothetical protein